MLPGRKSRLDKQAEVGARAYSMRKDKNNTSIIFEI
jgi:hypothetical protein